MLPRGMKITEAPGREPVPKMRVIVVWAGLDQRPEPIPGQDVVAGVKVRSGERLADAARGRLRSGSVAEHLGRAGGVAAVEQTQPTPIPVVDLSVRTPGWSAWSESCRACPMVSCLSPGGRCLFAYDARHEHRHAERR